MKKRNLYILYAMALLQGMVFYAPVATLYRQAAGLGIWEISLIESISLALTIALEIPWGWAADRLGYRKSMIFCCGLYFVSKLVFWQAESFAGFLLERILLSVVCAGLSGLDSSMLYLSCEAGESHRAFSIYQNLGELGMLAAAGMFALFLGERYRLSAALTAVSYGAAALLALGLQEVKPEVRRKDGEKFSLSQMKNKNLLCLILAAALLGETHQSVTVFLNQLKYQSLGMGSGAISGAFVAVSLLGLSGGFSAGLREKLGAGKMGNFLFLAGGLSCLTLAATSYVWLAVSAVLVLRCCFSLFSPLYQELQNGAITTTDRATALSMNAVIHDGLGIFLNLLFGAVAQTNVNGAFLLGAGLCMLGWMFYGKRT